MNTFTKVILAFLFVMLLGLLATAIFNPAGAQTTPPITEEIGKLMVTFNDSTKRNEFFTIYNQQGCPANIYIHDTMWQWGSGGYHNTPDPNPLPPVFIHDTLYVPVTTPPPVPALVSIFSTQTLPTVSTSDGQPITVGVKFRVSQTAYMKAVRFYKTAKNTGTHKGYLYSSTGAILDSGTFKNESDSTWQTLQLTKNVPLVPGTTYTAAYYSPSGQYSSTLNTFNSSITNGIVTALASGIDGVNGVYNYGAKAPTLTYRNSNYWTDIVISQQQ